MNIVHYFLLLFCFQILQLNAQNIKQAKEDLKVLCSKEMNGRGYSFDGVQKAEFFLSSRIKNMGLTVQKHAFELDANVFESKVKLSIDGKCQVAGKDFIVNASSPSLKGKYYLKKIEIQQGKSEVVRQIQKLKSSEIAIFDQEEINSSPHKNDIQEILRALPWVQDIKPAGVILYNQSKLTFSSSTKQALRPLFYTTKNISKNKKAKINLHAKLLKDYPTNNILVEIPGKNTDSTYLITAHYDHIGNLGKKVYFPGANDNASGVVFLLNLMEHFSKNKPKYSLKFILFSGEEIGLLGSHALVEDQIIDLNSVKFLLNFDIFGTGDEGVQIVNSSLYKKEYQLFKEINKEKQLIPAIKERGYACNSDHCAFEKEGVKTFFFYTLGGIRAYHDIYDKSETLPLTEFEDLHKLVVSFIERN
ncbi:MAG: M28 family metallopeptidase [Flavobacteriales bacterium]|jgi:hypothetical protein|nr:M28 family metallopeptidase [Flavobacteriales bacterium]